MPSSLRDSSALESPIRILAGQEDASTPGSKGRCISARIGAVHNDMEESCCHEGCPREGFLAGSEDVQSPESPSY